MCAQPVQNAPRSPAAPTAPQSNHPTLSWARVRELGEVIVAGVDPATIIERARELVDVLRRLEEGDRGPAACDRSRWWR
jgi:hypothetical protein